MVLVVLDEKLQIINMTLAESVTPYLMQTRFHRLHLVDLDSGHDLLHSAETVNPEMIGDCYNNTRVITSNFHSWYKS